MAAAGSTPAFHSNLIMNPETSKYLSEIGRRGGKVKSPAKTAAARKANAVRWEKYKAKKP